MIGVFDSGSGGLTVLKALRETFPDQHFIYYGDHANAPYGNRDGDTIYELTVYSLEQLFKLGCPLIIIACNTAAAAGLRRLQQTWLPIHHPNKRVLGVIVPTVEAMTGISWLAQYDSGLPRQQEKTVAVFATRYTVESRVFVEETIKRAPHVNLVQQACPSLVRLIEARASTHDLKRAVHRYVSLLMRRLNGKRLDAVLLGCTHYPLIENVFAEMLPHEVEIFSQPKLTANSLAAYLVRHPEFRFRDGSHRPGVTFYTSSSEPDHISKLAKQFLDDARVQFRECP